MAINTEPITSALGFLSEKDIPSEWVILCLEASDIPGYVVEVVGEFEGEFFTLNGTPHEGYAFAQEMYDWGWEMENKGQENSLSRLFVPEYTELPRDFYVQLAQALTEDNVLSLLKYIDD